MNKYQIDADGSVRSGTGNSWEILARIENSPWNGAGYRITDRTGQTLGEYSTDGTVRDSRGQAIGRVEASGVVRDLQGREVGTVEPPVFKHGALLLLLG